MNKRRANSVFAVIPARAGSKGLAQKNTRPLGGKPLIAWTIEAAKQSRRLTAAWVSTDSPEIAKASQAAGGAAPFLRPAELSSDEASVYDALRHAVTEFTKAQGAPDVVVLLQPTSPLRPAARIDETVDLLLAGADSAQTVTLDQTHPFHRFSLEGGRLKALFEGAEKLQRRQDAPAVYRPNGAVYAAWREAFEKTGTLKGADHRGVVMPFEESVDIDTVWDLKLAELILAQNA